MVEETSEEVGNPEASSAKAEPIKAKPKRSRWRKFGLSVVLIVLVGALVYGAFFVGSHRNQPSNAQKMQGTFALSERDLRDVVKAQKLTVFWTGPVAGNKYTLYVPKTGSAVVRYLPPGSKITDTSPTFRLVATYVQKNAFALAKAASLEPVNSGFVNMDGNAVFYATARPTNVFVGVKAKDVRLEIFDPGSGQAIALALFKGQIQQIK